MRRLVLLAIALVAGCSAPSAQPRSLAAPMVTTAPVLAPTASPIPTALPIPTSTATPTPSATPTPTPTTVPTPVPAPTVPALPPEQSAETNPTASVFMTTGQEPCDELANIAAVLRTCAGPWAMVVKCESEGVVGALSPGGTYRGLLQFVQSTWDSVAEANGWTHLIGVDPASQPVSVQLAMGDALKAMRGLSPWPVCGARYGS
jgi:Transglycosylase-like domain